MVYSIFFQYTNIADTNKRLEEQARFFKKLQINGLHYVNFFQETNTISISKPDHSTHHEATSFLLEQKNESLSINTVRDMANDLKKFLDFLMLWEIDITDGDLLITLVGFVDYLRIIEIHGDKSYPLPRRAIEWSMLDYLPLHLEARNVGKIHKLEINEYGHRKKAEWGQISDSLMIRIMSCIVKYIKYLERRTSKYSDIDLNVLPVKPIKGSSSLSSTINSALKIETEDLNGIFQKAGCTTRVKKRRVKALTDRITTIDEVRLLLSYVPTKRRQNMFLFKVLTEFGLRESEAANLMIDPATIPNELFRMPYFDAVQYLKEHLRGDIEFMPAIDKWVCSVVRRNSRQTKFSSRNKTGDRDIPYFFSQDEFSIHLYDALRERHLLMRKGNINHPYLFVSNASRTQGNRITGQGVYSKLWNYTNHLKNIEKLDFTWVSPHTFRHYFATYMLRVKKKELDDVSRYLGHSNTDITRKIYIHYLPGNDDKPNEIVRDICNSFDETRKES